MIDVSDSRLLSGSDVGCGKVTVSDPGGDWGPTHTPASLGKEGGREWRVGGREKGDSDPRDQDVRPLDTQTSTEVKTEDGGDVSR